MHFKCPNILVLCENSKDNYLCVGTVATHSNQWPHTHAASIRPLIHHTPCFSVLLQSHVMPTGSSAEYRQYRQYGGLGELLPLEATPNWWGMPTLPIIQMNNSWRHCSCNVAESVPYLLGHGSDLSKDP